MHEKIVAHRTLGIENNLCAIILLILSQLSMGSSRKMWAFSLENSELQCLLELNIWIPLNSSIC